MPDILDPETTPALSATSDLPGAEQPAKVMPDLGRMDYLTGDQRLAAEKLAGLGLKDYQIAAFLGHMHKESGMQAGIKQAGTRDPNAGRGWAQWTGPRRRTYEGFMKGDYSPEKESEFLAQELAAPQFAGALAKIKATPDLNSATQTILQYYGMGGGSAAQFPRQYATLPQRLEYAADYYNGTVPPLPIGLTER